MTVITFKSSILLAIVKCRNSNKELIFLFELILLECIKEHFPFLFGRYFLLQDKFFTKDVQKTCIEDKTYNQMINPCE